MNSTPELPAVRGNPPRPENIGCWTIGGMPILILVAGLLLQSYCNPRNREYAIESAFWGCRATEEHRDGKIVKLMFGAGFSDKDMKRLQGMADLTSLEELNLAETQVTGAGLLYIRDCRNLKTLVLDQTASGDDALAQLQPLSALQQLNLKETRISDRGLQHIGHLGNLRILCLMNTDISDDGVKHLENLRKLKTLWLNGTRVGDRGLESIAHLRELRSLCLTNTPVGDAGAAQLTVLRALERLDLDKTNVTDDALPALQSLSKLTFLDLRATRVTRRGVEALRKSLPQTRILD